MIENGWPLILTMIGSLEQDHSDILVRSAFQCLQLVFTDFLPAIPYRCYPICVETATKFGSQKAELNVSLAAVGLLWNLSDYFFQVMYLIYIIRNEIKGLIYSFIWVDICQSFDPSKSESFEFVFQYYYFILQEK